MHGELQIMFTSTCGAGTHNPSLCRDPAHWTPRLRLPVFLVAESCCYVFDISGENLTRILTTRNPSMYCALTIGQWSTNLTIASTTIHTTYMPATCSSQRPSRWVFPTWNNLFLTLWRTNFTNHKVDASPLLIYPTPMPTALENFTARKRAFDSRAEHALS